MPTLIDPDQIFPKRMGLYRGCLVIQYYNVDTDKFKKHVIPIDSTQSAQKNLQNILKTPKHSAFLKRVAPQHLKNLLSRLVGSEPQIIHHQNIADKHEKQKQIIFDKSHAHETNFQDSFKNNQSKNISEHSLSYSLDHKNKENGKHLANQIEDSYGYSMNFEEQLSMSIAKRKQDEEKAEGIEEEIMQYDEDFEDFQAEEVQEKQPLMDDDQKEEELRILDEKRRLQKERELEKQKEKERQKQRKKAQKKLRQEFQQFDFLDEEPKKKKKKKKKDKSKEKEAKKSEDTSKTTSNKAQDEIPIEQEFDFI